MAYNFRAHCTMQNIKEHFLHVVNNLQSLIVYI